MIKYLSSKIYSGATSLLITVGLGMILIVIIAGITTLSIREIRESSNVEQSRRALETAEAGVNDAVSKLAKDLNYQELSCTKIDQILPGQNVICRTVVSKFNNIDGFLQKDQAAQVVIEVPTGQLGPNYMQLRWHSNIIDKANPPYAFQPAGQLGFYPPVNGYNAAAAMEITFIYWPRAGSINQSFLGNEGLKTATIFFMPGNDDKAHPSINSRCQDQGLNFTQQTNLGSDFRCVTNADSAVGFNIIDAIAQNNPIPNNAADFNYVIRIKSRYTDTHFQLRVFNANSEELTLQSTKALIDVTAESGNLFRRIRAEKPIIPTALESVFDSVLYAGAGDDDASAKNICKNLKVLQTSELVAANTCE